MSESTVNPSSSFFDPAGEPHDNGSDLVAEIIKTGDHPDDFCDTSNIIASSANQSADPHDLKNPGKPTSNLQTLMNLIKGNVGIGILAMPSALVNAGLVMGTSGILILGFVATYCMKQLVDVSAHLEKKKPDIGILNYPDTCYEAFALGHPKIRKLAKPFRYLVNGFIVATQIMGCTAYLLFISTTISQLVRLMTSFYMEIQVWELVVLVSLLPYIQVRQLKILSFFTTIANVCVLVSLSIVFQYVIRYRDMVLENLSVWGHISKYPLAFGTIIFAFEGINLVMPLRNKMITPQDFGGWNGVLVLGMTIISVLYCFMGFFGYTSIGDEFEGVLTDYLIDLIKTDSLGWLYLMCIVLVVIQIYLSYGLQIYVAVIVLFPPISEWLKLSPTEAFIGESLFRCFLALITYALAAAIPCLGDIFNLIGALTGSCLSILFPATIDMITFIPVFYERGDKKRLVFLIVKNSIIIVLGFFGFFAGTFTSLQEIARKLSAGECAQ